MMESVFHRLGLVPRWEVFCGSFIHSVHLLCTYVCLILGLVLKKQRNKDTVSSQFSERDEHASALLVSSTTKPLLGSTFSESYLSLCPSYL